MLSSSKDTNNEAIDVFLECLKTFCCIKSKAIVSNKDPSDIHYNSKSLKYPRNIKLATGTGYVNKLPERTLLRSLLLQIRLW